MHLIYKKGGGNTPPPPPRVLAQPCPRTLLLLSADSNRDLTVESLWSYPMSHYMSNMQDIILGTKAPKQYIRHSGLYLKALAPPPPCFPLFIIIFYILFLACHIRGQSCTLIMYTPTPLCKFCHKFFSGRKKKCVGDTPPPPPPPRALRTGGALFLAFFHP